MIQAHQVEDGGVQVVDVDGVLGWGVPISSDRPKLKPGLPAPREKAGKTAAVVAAAARE